MTKSNAWIYMAVTAVVVCLPSATMAGTRAGDHKAIYRAAQAAPKASDHRGPQDGFPKTRGLEIAKIRADDHAAFKHRASNGC